MRCMKSFRRARAPPTSHTPHTARPRGSSSATPHQYDAPELADDDDASDDSIKLQSSSAAHFARKCNKSSKSPLARSLALAHQA